jgi:uncharacterized protein (DUF1015 family)
VRYDPAIVGSLATVVAAPYDIITPEAQREYYQRSPFNVVRLEYGIENPTDSSANNRYTRAAADYRDWLASGVLRPEAAPGFYLYDEALTDQGRPVVRRSLLAPVRLADWDEGVILPHEYTHRRAREDRLRLLEATRTQFSPLLGMYDAPGEVIDALARVARETPLVELHVPPGSVAAAAPVQRLWRVADPDLIAFLREALAACQIFIADGHHRYETALAYRDQERRRGSGRSDPSEYVLMALVATSNPGLQVFPTHRLLRDPGPIDARRVVDGLRRFFTIQARPIERDDPDALRGLVEEISRAGAGDHRPSFVALGLLPGEVCRLTLDSDVDLARVLPDVPPTLRAVDTVILQRLILEGALGLSPDEVERGERLSYTRNPEEVIEALVHGQAQVVFLLNPTPIAQIRDASLAGERMPQKTTYFYPKPVTGTVFFDHARAWSA